MAKANSRAQLPLITKKILSCSFRLERTYAFPLVVGVDEVGRGCLAGPVVVAAVAFPQPFYQFPEIIPEGLSKEDCEHLEAIQDSKKIPEAQREKLSEWILAKALASHIEACTNEEIDELNILQAIFHAGRKAVAGIQQKISRPIDLVLFDGHLGIPGLTMRQHVVVKGDAVSKSIAAASIIAKVHRDRWMTNQSDTFSGYGFEKHKGYATASHRAAIQRLGLTPLHRKSFCGRLQAQAIGVEGEARAAIYLEEQGYRILFRNWKRPEAEIDLVAEKDGEFHIFEVRSLSSEDFRLELQFPLSKQKQFRRAIQIFRRAEGKNLLRSKNLYAHLICVTPAKIEVLTNIFGL